MRTFCLLIATLLALSTVAKEKSFYDFTVKTIDGKNFPLSKLKGKKVLVVNVASKCGLTPQYKQLQELYDKYSKNKFVIIGFPANNFGKQEPGSNDEIKAFCTANYGVTFPMMEKISVKGDDIDPLYQWLTSKAQNGIADAEVTWNFQKFLIDEKGKWVGFVPPSTLPTTDEVIGWIEKNPVIPEILKEHKDKAAFTRLNTGFAIANQLFNGKNLNGWYSFTTKYGANNDEEKAFNVTDGALHLSGENMGYVCTKNSYKDYYLKIIFRWGEKKYPPRLNSPRDSGILYHFPESVGDKVWPTSIECQIQENDCGDYYCVGGTTADSPNESKMGGSQKRIIRTKNFEKPDQEWNTIEVICIGDKSEHYVNGHLVNEASNLTVSEGKILLQLEGAEIFYKTVELIPLK
jgi:glutathione peroxidase